MKPHLRSEMYVQPDSGRTELGVWPPISAAYLDRSTQIGRARWWDIKGVWDGREELRR